MNSINNYLNKCIKDSSLIQKIIVKDYLIGKLLNLYQFFYLVIYIEKERIETRVEAIKNVTITVTERRRREKA